MAKQPKEKTAEGVAARFPKAKILRMERFAGRRDLLGVLLQDSESYTLEEAEAAIRKFMKKG